MIGLEHWLMYIKVSSMFNDVITVYNHYVDKITHKEYWNRKVLDHCMWRNKVIKTVANNVAQIDTIVSLTLLNRSGYLCPKEYAKLSREEALNYFTLNAENNLDVIVYGEVSKELSDKYTLSDLRKEFDKVVTIAEVSDNTMVDSLKNWKVVAK